MLVIVGLELFEEAAKKLLIRQKMKSAQGCRKSYADKRRKNLKFQVGDFIFFRVSSTEGVVRFGAAGKLKPRYIGPFKILECVGSLAYKLALAPNIDVVYKVFHVLMLKKYVWDKSHILSNFQQLELQPNASYMEKPIKVFDLREKQSRQ